MLGCVVEEGGRLTGEQLPVPGRRRSWPGSSAVSAGAMPPGSPGQAIELACRQRDDLVPDQIVCDLLIPVAAAGGYIPGGFPATVPQAIRAAGLGAQLDLTLDAAVYLDVPEPVLVQRLPAWVRPGRR